MPAIPFSDLASPSISEAEPQWQGRTAARSQRTDRAPSRSFSRGRSARVKNWRETQRELVEQQGIAIPKRQASEPLHVRNGSDLDLIFDSDEDQVEEEVTKGGYRSRAFLHERRQDQARCGAYVEDDLTLDEPATSSTSSIDPATAFLSFTEQRLPFARHPSTMSIKGMLARSSDTSPPRSRAPSQSSTPACLFRFGGNTNVRPSQSRQGLQGQRSRNVRHGRSASEGFALHKSDPAAQTSFGSFQRNVISYLEQQADEYLGDRHSTLSAGAYGQGDGMSASSWHRLFNPSLDRSLYRPAPMPLRLQTDTAAWHDCSSDAQSDRPRTGSETRLRPSKSNTSVSQMSESTNLSASSVHTSAITPWTSNSNLSDLVLSPEETEIHDTLQPKSSLLANFKPPVSNELLDEDAFPAACPLDIVSSHESTESKMAGSFMPGSPPSNSFIQRREGVRLLRKAQGWNDEDEDEEDTHDAMDLRLGRHEASTSARTVRNRHGTWSKGSPGSGSSGSAVTLNGRLRDLDGEGSTAGTWPIKSRQRRSVTMPCPLVSELPVPGASPKSAPRGSRSLPFIMSHVLEAEAAVQPVEVNNGGQDATGTVSEPRVASPDTVSPLLKKVLSEEAERDLPPRGLRRLSLRLDRLFPRKIPVDDQHQVE